MDKNQLKEAVGELNLVDTVFEADGVSYIDTAVSVMQVYDLIDQLDEPVKVVVPRFVAEAFEKVKGSNVYAESILKDMYNSSDEVANWLVAPSNEKLLLRAWLDGYEIEKEPLYYAKLKVATLPNWDNNGDDFFATLDDSSGGAVFLYERHDSKGLIKTLSEWNQLGIDEAIAIFIPEEVAE